MLSILITVAGKRVIKRIIKNDRTKQLNFYFIEPIIIGFLMILISMVMTPFTSDNTYFGRLILMIEGSVVVYFILSAIRVIYILMVVMLSPGSISPVHSK
jgi:hypothetical protein